MDRIREEESSSLNKSTVIFGGLYALGLWFWFSDDALGVPWLAVLVLALVGVLILVAIKALIFVHRGKARARTEIDGSGGSNVKRMIIDG